MKTKLTFLVLPVAIILSWFFAQGSESIDRGPHGGEIKAVDQYYIEMKSEPATIYAYFLDRNKMSVRNPNLKCEAKLMYADSTVTKIDLLPYGVDGFSGKIVADNYNTCLITFTFAGEKVSAAFENKTLLVTNQ